MPVVVGLLVYRGSQKAARLAFIAASFIVGSLLLLPVTLPISYPPRLLWLKVQLAPGEATVAVLVVALSFATCVGVVLWLGRVPLGRLGRFSPRAYRNIAAALGFSLSVFSAVFITVGFEQSEVYRRAIAEARAQVGPGYSFRVKTLTATPENGHAQVLAYSDTEIRTVEVQWGDD